MELTKKAAEVLEENERLKKACHIPSCSCYFLYQIFMYLIDSKKVDTNILFLLNVVINISSYQMGLPKFTFTLFCIK